jgi:hypothetical protein
MLRSFTKPEEKALLALSRQLEETRNAIADFANKHPNMTPQATLPAESELAPLRNLPSAGQGGHSPLAVVTDIARDLSTSDFETCLGGLQMSLAGARDQYQDTVMSLLRQKQALEAKLHQ